MCDTDIMAHLSQPVKASTAEPPQGRILIVSDDDGNWYVRAVRLVEHDLDNDEKVYRCDQPIGGKYKSLAEVPQVRGTSRSTKTNRG